jgi:hypothetical protein
MILKLNFDSLIIENQEFKMYEKPKTPHNQLYLDKLNLLFFLVKNKCYFTQKTQVYSKYHDC